MSINLYIGPEIIRSYKRLPYTPWYALGEFIDNSTQSYLENKDGLDAAYDRENTSLTVSVEYERSGNGKLVIRDNAMGMSLDDLNRALYIGKPPEITSGRSEFGMGMKTAACWFGDNWTIETKKLGRKDAHVVHVDVEQVASGDMDLIHSEREEAEGEHYTVVIITNLHQQLVGPIANRTKQFLASMYRMDIREPRLTLLWNGEQITWRSPRETGNIHRHEGELCIKDFEFSVGDKQVRGWIGIMERGSRSDAGFSIIRRGRVIKGWPESWRPQAIFGQLEGSNDLINQRLMGEIHLDDFMVSHTKDGILWGQEEEHEVELRLLDVAVDYIEIARSYRKRGVAGDRPSRAVVRNALGIFEDEISSPEFQSIVKSNGTTPRDMLEQSALPMIRAMSESDPSKTTSIDGLTLNLFLADELTATDPYLGVDITSDGLVNVVVNMNHPHIRDIKGSMGVLNYIKYCVYEGIAEWKANKNWTTDNPSVIRAIKDSFLRIGRGMGDEADK